MNLDIIQSTKEGEITQFLCDVRDYFKASLTTSEYENTSNLFYVTASEKTEKLLNRCEALIKRLNVTRNRATNTSANEHCLNSTSVTDSVTKNEMKYKEDLSSRTTGQETEMDDVSYLDMSATAFKHNTLKDSDDERKLKAGIKAFRYSTIVVEQNKSFLYEMHDTITTTTDKAELEDEVLNGEVKCQTHDECQIKAQGSDNEDVEIAVGTKQSIITSNTYSSLPHIDCPYMDLPAGHLSIYKSTKYGQLQKIEKRLFFDQSKKCYCGILNDWLLCYVDGPTSSRPTACLYLKMPYTEVEHYGEGKRRDVCFQISTCDANKRFIFQAINEIDAKEWIHALETAIRSDIHSLDVQNLVVHKFSTSPVIKNITFLSSFQRNNDLLSTDTMNDGIYEEPVPIQQFRELIKPPSVRPPELPSKLNIHLSENNRFEYDVPKCPAQRLIDSNKIEESNQSGLSNLQPAQETNVVTVTNPDFHAIVKDVHNKLSSQLSSVSNPKKPLKKSVTSLLKNDGDLLNISCNLANMPVNELKKQIKLTPNTSLQQKASNEKILFSKNWFLNKINKSNSSTRSNSPSPSNSPSKCKQSEKENLLSSSSDACDGYETNDNYLFSNPASSPVLKTNSLKNGTSKVNMIINQLEASGHLASKFSTDTPASISSFCDGDCNNYEPIMSVSIPPSNLIKKELN